MTADTQATRLVAEIEAGLEGLPRSPWRAEGSIYEHMAAEIVAGPLAGRGVAQVWQSPGGFGTALHIARASDPDNWRIILAHIAAETARAVSAEARAKKAERERDAAKAEMREMQDAESELLTIAHLQGAASERDRLRAMQDKGRADA